MHAQEPLTPGTKAPPAPPPSNDDEWVAVEGLDAHTVKLKREYEAEVEQKVATDHVHVIWAYGLIWAIFAVYGAILWKRSLSLGRDVDALRSQIDKRVR